MDIEAFRQEVASYLPTTGWNVYPYVLGAPELPALLVGLPDEITPGASFVQSKITFPIHVVVAFTDEAPAQLTLMSALKSGDPASVLDALNAHKHGTTYKGLNVTSIGSFGSVTVATATALTCDINLSAFILS